MITASTMDGIVFYSVVLVASCVAGYLWRRSQGQRGQGNPIPGPSLVGGLRTVFIGGRDNTLHLMLPAWAKKYGDIMEIDLLMRKAVFINDADVFRRLVKDADLRDFTNDRPSSFCANFHFAGGKDLAFAKVGKDLQLKRRVFHNILKFYGEGREQYEQLFVSSLEKLTQNMMGKDTVELTSYLQNYVLSLVGFLLTGDMSEEAQKNLNIIHTYSEAGKKLLVFEHETFLTPFPFLRLIPGLRFKPLHDAVCAAIRKLHNTYFYAIKKSYNRSQKKGMVEELMGVQEDLREKGHEIQFDDETLRVIIQNVVGAAYLTTSSTLASLFLHLIKHQDIQAKIYEEIKTVIGDASPSFQHRQDMPYTEAVILETLRISSGLPFLLHHLVTKDIHFEGYFIPKSTILIMNAWYSHHREDFWGDPFVFKPERFLDENGQLLDINHPVRLKMIPFGTGRRSCPGETFGKSRMFLVTTCILQAFQVLPDDESPLPSSDPREWAGATVMGPDPYKCKIKPRGAS